MNENIIVKKIQEKWGDEAADQMLRGEPIDEHSKPVVIDVPGFGYFVPVTNYVRDIARYLKDTGQDVDTFQSKGLHIVNVSHKELSRIVQWLMCNHHDPGKVSTAWNQGNIAWLLGMYMEKTNK